MKKVLFAIGTVVFALIVASCFSSKGGSNASGGEVYCFVFSRCKVHKGGCTFKVGYSEL